MELSDVGRISCQELLEHINAGQPVTVIDTRTSGEYIRAHIPGAININYDPSKPPFEREILLSALPSDSLLVLYCD
jgi:rhodanese-related sulfurtransferase